MSGRSETNKEDIKKELRKLFRSMDFISKKFLAVQSFFHCLTKNL